MTKKGLIIVVEHGDINFFSSKELAERYIEPVDVINNEYVIYDSSGLVLEASIVTVDKAGVLTRGVSRVKIKEGITRDSATLRKYLINLLKEPDDTREDFEHILLEELISLAVDKVGITN